MDSRVIELRSNNREYAKSLVDSAPDGYVMEIHKETRSKAQNAKMWPMLRDLSRQVEYHGYKLSIEEWKDFAVGTLNQQKFVPNLDGTGFIVVGGRTSTMSKQKFSDLLEMIYMIGAKFGVQWSEESRRTMEDEHVSGYMDDYNAW